MSTISSDALDYQQGVQSEPLTEQELKLINRLFSDPTVLPRDFKRWVTDHASDSVDITKSQVHGLITASGGIYIPPPEFAVQVKHIPFIGLVSMPVGAGGQVTSIDAETDGNTVIWEFYAPFCEYHSVQFYLYLDGIPSNVIGAYASSSGPVGGPWTNKARNPVYLTMQFKPSEGMHNFAVNAQTQGSGGQYFYIGGGQQIYSDYYAPGFTRITRA